MFFVDFDLLDCTCFEEVCIFEGLEIECVLY